ncbi:MAG TPA: AMP-binding protein, partial [Longimicrobiaceae bacterium]|nr:AMP-binding protein [Longimicrobiaceae bacterium]
PHRGIASLVAAQGEAFGVGEGSRVLQFASPSFDAAVSEVFVTLGRGATLHLAPRDALLPGPGLLRLLRRQAISTVTLPPSALGVLSGAGGVPPLPELETLVLAGERIPAEVAAAWAARVPRVINAYGPTECTVCVTLGACDAGREQPPPIGRPVADARVHVLDAGLDPVPDGDAGELCVGGAGVARGYLDRPGPTAERFVPDPFGGAGGRLYRTGDRVRRLPTGELEFLGRLDDQVKVRGFRIEPGEVETALLAHPGVRECVVVAREDAAGESRLVAYVVPGDAPAPGPDALAARLGEHLPGHMVPSTFVALERLPLTPSGKLDRAALPAPDARRPELGGGYAAPGTPLEEELAAAWAAVLEVERVGVHDRFLDLGGDSLRAARIAARVQESLGVELPIRTLLDSPTVSRLADAVLALGPGAAGPRIPPLVPVPRDGPLPLSSSQEGVWFLQRLVPDGLSYHAHATVRLRGELDVAALEASLGEIVRRHEIFRTTFPEVDGRPVQRIHPPFPVRLPVADFRRVPAAGREAEVQRWLDRAFRQGFDLERLPLARWSLLRVDERDHVLVHVEHHLVHDGWSFNLWLGELLTLYRA